MRERVTLTREELYELVWERPMSRLAAQFSITDVGLAKLCSRHNIPRPPRGYWARVGAGKSPPKPKLPPLKNGTAIEITVRKRAEPTGSADRSVEETRKPENRVTVATALRAPCDLVREAKAVLTNADANQLGLLQPAERCLDIRVSREQLGRALRIADALLKAFAKRGWEVTVRDDTTDVLVDDVPIALAIEEQLESIEVAPNVDLGGGRYSFHYDRRETVRRPSGRLLVGIREHHHLWFHNQQRNWRGSDKRAVEERLDGVLVGMLKLADAVRTDVARKEREALEEQERQRKLEEALDEQRRLRAAIAEEKKRVEQLLDQAARWRDSQNVRSFIEHAQERGCLPELGLEGEEFERWLEWAHLQADRIDPMTSSPASIIDEEDRVEHLCDSLKGRR